MVLHLHGSPLFIDRKKLRREERATNEPSEKCHLILAPVCYKPTLLLSTSDILVEYWRRFARALRETSRIILFGYAGLDTHLNRCISEELKTATHKIVSVIEWASTDPKDIREEFWQKQLGIEGEGHRLHLQQKENILFFAEWGDLLEKNAIPQRVQNCSEAGLKQTAHSP